jgi:hypothetical protein
LFNEWPARLALFIRKRTISWFVEWTRLKQIARQIEGSGDAHFGQSTAFGSQNLGLLLAKLHYQKYSFPVDGARDVRVCRRRLPDAGHSPLVSNSRIERVNGAGSHRNAGDEGNESSKKSGEWEV